jgi:hypothetical protein
MVNDLVYLRDPALAGFRRFTLVVDFAKIKKENKFRNSSDFLGNQILATLSAKSASDCAKCPFHPFGPGFSWRRSNSPSVPGA